MASPVFISHNPGGFRALLPVMHALPEAATLLTEALSPLAAECKGQPTIIPKQTSRTELEEKLLRLQPSLLITGTSVTGDIGGQLENWARQWARRKGIPSISVLDHWCNYTPRYSEKERLDSLPDAICIMDERARNEMIAEGFPPEILIVTGQPAFDEIIRSQKPALASLRKIGREHLGLPENIQVVGFVSEPLSQNFSGQRPYDELTVAEDLIDYFSQTDTLLLFKRHPRDISGKFEELASLRPELLMREIGGDCPPREFVAACDLVIGMTSILLLESLILGLPVISFQPGTKKEDACHQSIQPVPVCNALSHLSKFINHAKMPQSFQLSMPYPACDRILKLIEQMTVNSRQTGLLAGAAI